MIRTNGPLHIEVVKNAIASPFFVDRAAGKLRGCIFDQRRNRIDLSLRTSGIGGDVVVNDDPTQLSDEVVSSQRIEGESIYLGHLMGHYGHFITETLSPFWGLQHSKNANVVFHPFIFGYAPMPFMSAFFEAFNIDPEKIFVVRDVCEFDTLIIPERTFHLNSAVHERYQQIISEIIRFHVGEEPLRTRRIFLSRSKLPPNSREIANGAEIDHLFESLGFEVIHPQMLTTREQLSIYGTTKIMIGFAGSALHNGVFLDDRCLLIELCDRRWPHKPIPSQTLCNLSSGVQAAHVPYKPLEPNNTDPAAELVDLACLKASIISILERPGYIG